VAPGQIPEALRFVSLALHILPHIGQKAPQVRFSEECFRIALLLENVFLKSPTADLLHTSAENPQQTASLDELAEPNYYSKCFQTSSTYVFASQDFGVGIAKQLWRDQVEFWTTRDPSPQKTAAQDFARGLYARETAQLADFGSILYTTSFPNLVGNSCRSLKQA
jgi:hypothetical protein